jgi:hypothetical protein
MFNMCMSMHGLRGGQPIDYSDAYNAIQKANYYAKVFVEECPPSKRQALEEYTDAWTGVVFSEIAIRVGDVDLSRRKIGKLLDAYSRMRPSLQRLLVSNCEVRD